MNLKIFVRHYSKNLRQNKENEFDWFETQPSLESAIINATEAINERGKQYSHQWRVNKISINNAKSALLENADDIEKTNSFHNLWLLVNKIIKPINGIGELYIYDTALRIGAFLKIYPEKVYLHAGTRIGANCLKLKSANKNWLESDELPEILQELPMNEVEDILCIYKDDFLKENIVSAKSCSNNSKTKKC